MKNLSLIILTGLIFLVACKNESLSNRNIESTFIEGFWEGEYKINDRPDIDPQYINLLVKKDGSVTNECSWFNELRINLGTWELKDNAFKYQVSNVVGGENPNPLIGSATFDPTGKLVEGIWQNLSGSNSGTFEMVKRK